MEFDINKIKTKIAISKIKDEDNIVMENKLKVIFRNVIVATIGIVVSTGVVFAGTMVYENVWKEPKKVSYEDKEDYYKNIEQIVKAEIKDEEKIGFITEEEAVEIAKDKLEILGYNNIEFKSVKLIRDYNSNIHFVLTTGDETRKGILVHINPKTSELEYFADYELGMKGLKCDNITESQANEIAQDLYTRLGIIKENDGYEITETVNRKLGVNNVLNDTWQVTYGKKYNNLIDNNSKFTICFTVQNGKSLVHILKGKTETAFNLNEIVISENEAKEIAINKEKQFSNLNIDEVNSNLAIEKMNTFVYYLDNNIENSEDLYVIDNDDSRVVWVIEVKHNKNEKITKTDLQTVKEFYNKKYYIDATTGEIIGGEQAENS